MDETNLDRRRMPGGMAAAAGTGLAGTAVAQEAATAWPDMGASQPPPITDVRDKVAYITGGSSGIGLGIARALHEAGAKVILGNLDDSQFAEALKEFPPDDPRVRTIVHDVLDRDGWEAKADLIEKMFGPVHILVNNAGVGRLPDVIAATMKDWEWGMGVNFWGPLCGIRTFVPRMLAHGQGSHIVTTSSTDGVLPGTGNLYAVSKMAVSGLMEALRQQLRTTHIGTSNLCPGAAARPEPAPMWARPQSPLTVGRLVVNGIINNDMWIFPAPEYRAGMAARGQAMAESMVAFTPMPENIGAGRDNYFRTPIYVQEIAHRRATRQRDIPGI